MENEELKGKTLVCAVCKQSVGDKYRIVCHSVICERSNCFVNMVKAFTMHIRH